MGEEEQMKYAWRVVDLIVGGIFVYAGVSKVLDPAQFANDIDNYKTLPWFVSVRLAFYLPWLEIFCGLAVISRFFYRGGLSILTALQIQTDYPKEAPKSFYLNVVVTTPPGLPPAVRPNVANPPASRTATPAAIPSASPAGGVER